MDVDRRELSNPDPDPGGTWLFSTACVRTMEGWERRTGGTRLHVPFAC